MIGLIIPTVFILGIVSGACIHSIFIEYEKKSDGGLKDINKEIKRIKEFLEMD